MSRVNREKVVSMASEPRETLAEWAGGISGLDQLKNTRLADGLIIDSALEVVRDFIAERQLILYGGQAIDFALRAAGAEPIYPDTERPDYDFYSPQHYKDAYELGKRLVRQSFPGVSVINAVHPQTMRVRVNFTFVADISYLPPSVFSRLPKVMYKGLPVVHPDFQRCDMHLDQSNPLKTPGMEEIFSRGKKTAKRLRMFDKAYPVGGAFGDSHPPAKAAPPDGKPEATTGGADVITVPSAYLEKSGEFVAMRALSGHCALAAYRALYLRLKSGPLPDLPDRDPIDLTIRAVDAEDSSHSYEITGGELSSLRHVDVVTASTGAPTEDEKALAGEWRRPFLDLTGEICVVPTPAGPPLRFDTHPHSRPSCTRADLGDGPPLFLVSPAGLLVHLLLEAWEFQWAGDTASAKEYLDLYRSFYEDIDAVQSAVVGKVGPALEQAGPLLSRCPFGYPLGQLAGCVATVRDVNSAKWAFRNLRWPPPTVCGRPMHPEGSQPTVVHFDRMLAKARAAKAKAVQEAKEGDEAQDGEAPDLPLPVFDYDTAPADLWRRDGGEFAPREKPTPHPEPPPVGAVKKAEIAREPKS